METETERDDDDDILGMLSTPVEVVRPREYSQKGVHFISFCARFRVADIATLPPYRPHPQALSFQPHANMNATAQRLPSP